MKQSHLLRSHFKEGSTSQGSVLQLPPYSWIFSDCVKVFRDTVKENKSRRSNCVRSKKQLFELWWHLYWLCTFQIKLETLIKAESISGYQRTICKGLCNSHPNNEFWFHSVEIHTIAIGSFERHFTRSLGEGHSCFMIDRRHSFISSLSRSLCQHIRSEGEGAEIILNILCFESIF